MQPQNSNWQWQDWSGWQGGNHTSSSSTKWYDEEIVFFKSSERKTRPLDRKRDDERVPHDLSGACG